MTENSLALPPNVRMLVVPGAGTVLLADRTQREVYHTIRNPASNQYQENQMEKSPISTRSPNQGCFGLSLGSVPETSIPGDPHNMGYDARVYQTSTKCLEDSQFLDYGMGTNSVNEPPAQRWPVRPVYGGSQAGTPGESRSGPVGCGPRCRCLCLYCCGSGGAELNGHFGASYHCQCRPWSQEYIPHPSNQRWDAQLAHSSQNASNGDARKVNNNDRSSYASWIPEFIKNAPQQQGYSSRTRSVLSDPVTGKITVENELTFDPRASFRFEYKFRNKFVLNSIQTMGTLTGMPSEGSSDRTPTSIQMTSSQLTGNREDKPFGRVFSKKPQFSPDDIMSLLKDELGPMLSNNFYMPLSQVFQPPQPETYLGANEGSSTGYFSGFDRIASQLKQTHATVHAAAFKRDETRPHQEFPESGNLECLGLYMSANFGPFLDLALQFDPNRQRDPHQDEEEEVSLSGDESPEDRSPVTTLRGIQSNQQPATGFTDSLNGVPDHREVEAAPSLSRFLETLEGTESFIFTNEFYEEYLANQLDEDDYDDSYSEDSDDGLSEQALNALPVVLYQPSPSNKPEEADHCTICLIPLEEQEQIKKLGCRHFFHPRCIDIWLGKHNCCPLCKQAVVVPAH